MSHRIQLDLSKEAFNELLSLQKQAKVLSKAATIRNALAIYKWFLDTVDKKGEILVRNPNGEIEKITFIGNND